MATKSITIRTVEALKAGEQVWDSGRESVKGFGVRRQVAGAVYVLKYRFKGVQRFFTIGRHGAPWTPETARTEARRLLGLVSHPTAPRDPAAEREAAKGQPTIADFFARYVAEYGRVHKKPSSVTEDERNFRLHVAPVIGAKRIGDVTRRDMARIHGQRAAHPANANRCLALVSHLFTIAAKWGVVPEGHNPARGIEAYPERRRERFLSAAELQRLGAALARAERGWPDAEWAALPADARKAGRRTPEDWRAIACIRLLAFTGARLSEVLHLQWDWIDFGRGVARLPDSKTGAKNLHLSPPALDVLHALPRLAGSPFVLPADRAGRRPADAAREPSPRPFVGVHHPWKRICRLADLPGLRIHDLRHAFASLAVANNEALYLVGAVLGHRQATTTERYAHLTADPVKAVADRTAERVAAMLSGTAGAVVPLHPAKRA